MRYLISLSMLGCIENSIQETKKFDDPIISVVPDMVDFGYLDMGSSATETITISNIGGSDLEIEDISILSSTAFSFTLPQPITILSSGQSADVIVSYETLNESDTTDLRIENSDLSHAVIDVPLFGQASFPALEIDPNPYQFRYEEVGEHTEGTINLNSVGHAQLIIDNVLLTGEGFTLLQPELPIILDPEESYPLTVYFDPTEVKHYEGTLWVSNNSFVPSQTSDIYGDLPAGSITGRLCDPSGDGWVVGAVVYISIDYNGDGIEDVRIQTTTDADGYFTLEDVPTGNYTIHAEKGSYSAEIDVEFYGGDYEFEEEYCLDPESVNIAVVNGEFDHIGQILTELELNYDSYGSSTYMNLLTDLEKMNEYDIIFFNCGMPFTWQNSQSLVTSNLSSFVAEGGSVYASDWAHQIIEAAWPNKIDFVGHDHEFPDPYVDYDLTNTPYVGQSTYLEANVLDGTMSQILGSTAQINYDLDAWVVPLSMGSGASAMLTGTAPAWDLTTWDTVTYQNVPLAVRFAPGGTVIYTTFHNESQMTSDMELALKEMILNL